MDREIRGYIENYQFGKMTKALYNFCNDFLSAFYFDIRKDRLYCDRPDMFERRACRTVMAELYKCLTCWLAPILCFTAEEAWSHRPEGIFEAADSVHLRVFPDVPADWKNADLSEKWSHVRKIRKVVLGAIEPHRANKTIGSSLEAHPTIFLDESYYRAADGIDLAEVCIVSQVSVESIAAAEKADDVFSLSDVSGVAVAFHKAEGEKCQRCWKILPEVGSDPEYPDLTKRDADAVRWYIQNRKAA